MPNVIREYLVKLGFTTDMVQYGRFSATLREASSLIDASTTNIARKFLGLQAGISGALFGMAGGLIGLADNAAMADQEYRLLALHMFTSLPVARELKVAMDALGQPLENIAWDPELARRFSQLVKDQQVLTKELGPDFENQMLRIRDLRFEFNRFGVELKYLTFLFVKDFARALGTDVDGVLRKFQGYNQWLIENLPQISDWLVSRFKPIFSDTVDLAKQFAVTFQNLVGLFSGDNSIEGTVASFNKMAIAIKHVTDGVADLAHALIDSQSLLLHVINAASLASSGHYSEALAEAQKAGVNLRMGTGAAIGAGIGGVLAGPGGAIVGGMIGGATGRLYEQLHPIPNLGAMLDEAIDAKNGKEFAQKAGAKLGIPPDLIYRQWEFESKNFGKAVAPGNFAGIGGPGHWESFDTWQDFIDRYTQILQGPRFSGLAKPTTIEGMADYLAKGHYYTHGDNLPATPEDIANYGGGMRQQAGLEGHPIYNIVINAPNGDAKSIAMETERTIQTLERDRAIRVQRNIMEFQGWAYGGG